MAGRFSWMESTDDKVAVQLQTFGQQLPGFATSLGVATTDVTYLQAGAAAYAYFQLQLLPAVRNFSTSVTQGRDNFEVDSTPEPLLFPTPNFPAPPTPPAGVALSTDFFDWCDNLVKRIKLSANYNEQIGKQLSIVPASSPVTEGPSIRSVKALPGGVLQLDVYRGGHPMVIVETLMDNGAWIKAAQVAASKVSVSVTPGAAHKVQLRSRFAERDGTAIGDYSPILTTSSLP